MQGTVLIVEPDSEQATALKDALLEDGWSVEVVSTFQAARQILAAGGVGVLVTAVRLAAFNGLHLVIRTRALYPQTGCIVMGLPADRCRDLGTFNVPFLQKPVDPATLVAAVSEEIERAAAIPQRRWPRKPVHLPAVVSDADIDIVDLSYGGIRLQCPRTSVSVGSEMTVNVPSLGVSVTAVARWTKQIAQGGDAWCGAEIIEPPAGAVSNWRGLVDSLS
jgi:DNA-binding response OmpR family regulator